MRELFLMVFALFTLMMGLGVVLSRNAVYSALSLILSFFGLAGIYILMNSTLLAVIQILIYTGAIVVLFVFVVMLLNLERTKKVPVGRYIFGLLSLLIAAPIAFIILKSLNMSASGAVETTQTLSIRQFSVLLFTQYLWPFEILSFFLLALIVAVWSLARPLTEEEEREEGSL